MQPNQENFDALRRLLKLKRYEQPPPRYFNEFSANVIAAIRAGNNTRPETVPASINWAGPWVRRFLSAFQAKPAFAGVFGAALCLLVIAGIVSVERTEALPQASIGTESESDQTVTAEAFRNFNDRIAQWNASTNPVVSLPGSVFDVQNVSGRGPIFTK